MHGADPTCNYDFKIAVDDNAHLHYAFAFRTLDFAMSRDEFSTLLFGQAEGKLSESVMFAI
jgi:hypothetical protein